MSERASFASEYYWLQGVTQSLDVGLIVLDLDYHVVLWNEFMDNHYCGGSPNVLGRTIFELFDDLPELWFRQKVKGVLQFKARAFSTWEQRPYLFRMEHYRPFTSPAEYMYQNITILPLMDLAGKIAHIGILVYDVTDVALQKLELQNTRDELNIRAKTDALTQLYNRGYWEVNLEKEFNRHRRTQQTPCLIVLDIDHFKQVNDTYGHLAGDEIIKALANLLTENLRGTDVIGRLGGEEFGVILIDTKIEQAEMLANRLRGIVEEAVTHYSGTDIKITCSFGVTELTAEITNQEQWYGTADAGLYESKNNGRNQVTVKTPD